MIYKTIHACYLNKLHDSLNNLFEENYAWMVFLVAT